MKPIFHCCNFNNTVTVFMNREFALQIYDVISSETEGPLAALARKIERQFVYMGVISEEDLSG